MVMRADRTFTFTTGASVSTSQVVLNGITLLRIPQMEATTANLRVQHSLDPMSVPDATAVWSPALQNEAGTIIEFPASAAAATACKVDPSNWKMVGRIRFQAVTSGDVAVVQAGQVVRAVFSE